jgi:hypothetical protein
MTSDTKLSKLSKPVLEFFIDEKDARAFVRIGPPDDGGDDLELPADRQRAKLTLWRLIAAWGYDPRDMWSKQVGAVVLSKGDLNRLRPYFKFRAISKRAWLAGE